MIDAAIPITQSAVETFTRQYLTDSGCTIETAGEMWEITAPPDAKTEVVEGRVTLYCGIPDDPAGTAGSGGEPLHPKSAFFQELLAEASERAPVGTLTLETDETAVIIPDWLTESDVAVTDTEFYPYYDRIALVVLFRVRIETVSEYQRELLQAVAVDSRSGETLSNLAETVLESVDSDNYDITHSDGPDALDSDYTVELVETARSVLMDQTQPTIDDIQQQASRAVQREVEDYRRMQQQRQQELTAETRHLQNRIEDISTQIDDASQDNRIELLKERRGLRNELDDVEAELSDLQCRRRQGFPARQQEIRDRHSLTVAVTPVTLTYVEYERGDVEFHLDDAVGRLTLGYGVGEGTTERVHCGACGRELNGDQPLGKYQYKVRCVSCSSN